jgi:predicted RNA-binding protein with RPS1 domain
MESKGIDNFHTGDRAIMKIDGFKFGGFVRKTDKVKNLVHIKFDYDGYVSKVAPNFYIKSLQTWRRNFGWEVT